MESVVQEKDPVKTEPSWDSVSLEDEPSCPVFIKDEPPSDGSVEVRPSFLNVYIKEEILNTEASCSSATEKRLDVTVKVERVKEECGVSACAAAEGLYADHAVKRELVLGPTLVETSSEAKGRAPQEEQGKRLNTYRCDYCAFKTAKKCALVIHLRMHTTHDTPVCKNEHTEKPYKCDQCSYATGHKFHLKLHKRIHNNDRPYKCNLCSYATVGKSRLIRHERIHTGEKPYKCDRCSYATGSKSNLRQHERIHNRGVPYKCDRCSYATAHKAFILRHTRLHSGEPPVNKTKTAIPYQQNS